MYIHEVIIDGFKSYATKTVVSGFDPHFNAITGLNGTGKSNILDAICFVLGIPTTSSSFEVSLLNVGSIRHIKSVPGSCCKSPRAGLQARSSRSH
jgi:AAA15 family ATPase/GTPase